jgi:4-alpha-glucanotransferase
MKISFHINFHTVWGQKLCVVGSVPELGAWEIGLAKEMDYVGDGNWQLSIDIDPNVEILEYRYFVRVVNDWQVFEEWERNHRATLEKQIHTYAFYDYWQAYPANIAFYSSAFTQSLFAHSRNRVERVVKSRKRLTIKILAPRVEKNQCLALTGNQPCLGNWQPEKALILSCDTFPEWQIDLDAEEIHYPLEYKFLILNADTHKPVYWELGENRVLTLPAQMKGETIYVSGLYFREDLPHWRCAGSVIPVFSLRSANSFGVGDLSDLRLFIDWVKKTGQRIVQVLPVNDTTATHTWTDSYPYSAISIYALHPMYVSLSWLGLLHDTEKTLFFEEKQKELNSLENIDYEAVMTYKTAYCRMFFEQEGKRWLDGEEFKDFFARNKEWLVSYAAYAYFRDTYKTPDFSKWGNDAVYSKTRVEKLCSRDSRAWPEISFTFFMQFVLHTQFKAVSD